MRYVVEVQGEKIEVVVRSGPQGLEVAVGGEPELRPARLAPAPAPLYTLELGATRHRVRVEQDPMQPGGFTVSCEGKLPTRVLPQDARSLAAGPGRAATKAKGPILVRSAMPGQIVEVRVEPGVAVAKGEVLLILEAMKMQNEIRAEAAGVVSALHVGPGDSVAAGDKLVEFGAPQQVD